MKTTGGPLAALAGLLFLVLAMAAPAAAQASWLQPGGDRGAGLAGQSRLSDDPYGFQLMLSASPDRSDAEPLAGQQLSGFAYIFLNAGLGQTGVPALEIDRVHFALDDRQFNVLLQVEGLPPYDLSGTTGTGLANPLNTLTLVDGNHVVSAEVFFQAGGSIKTSGSFTSVGGSPVEPQDYELVVSSSALRVSPVPLEGQVLVGDIYVFLTPEIEVSSVAFHVDDPGLVGAPFHVEGTAPYDLVGEAPGGEALPFDTLALPDGLHDVTAVVSTTLGPTVVVGSSFTVGNTLPRLVFDTSPLVVAVLPGDLVSTGVTISASDAQAVTYSLSEQAGWLEIGPVQGTTPTPLFVDIDSSSLPPGTYVATVTASAPGYIDGTFNVVLEVGDNGGCVPLDCGLILVDLPYELDFASDHDMIRDTNGVGTGFTYLDPTSNGTGLVPGLLTMDTVAGELHIQTTAGIAFKAFNDQDNALGVGIDAPSQVSIVETTLVDIPAGTGGYEQAGLWFGLGEDDYVKLVVASTPGGTRVQYAYELAGQTVSEFLSPVFDPTALDALCLSLKIDPFAEVVEAEYAFDDGPLAPLASVAVPSEFFSFDAAGIDPAIGTRSFTGIFATHRSGPAPLVYTFDDFRVTEGPSISAAGDLDFEQTSLPMVKPTALVAAPDGRIYATNVTGQVHAFTLDADNQLVGEEVITSLTDDLGEDRLALGLALDPLSSAGDVILYVAHSNANQGNGQINSGMVSRLSGPGHATVEHVITGLPRALANHSVNHLHFGDDMRLYIAVGGNTGAGAPNLASTEFGDRAEQPLSAAIVVADLNARAFDGSCDNELDPYGPPPCSVTTWATGLRNVYDFVFHSNGSVYAADNGLGVTGTFPPSPTAPCPGLADPALVPVGHNPGPQTDPLLRLEAGKYYGHPNPSRDECVFKDGSLQGVPAPANYVAPIHDLGNHRSANGIVEYPFDVGCVGLGGDLLITNYSTGDDITRIKLTPDGLDVLDAASFVGGFDDPLALAVDADGDIFVAEFGGDSIAVLRPRSLGCWDDALAPVPEAILDASGAVVDGELYMVGGKTSSAHVSATRVYDPVADSWSSVADVPGPAREDIAVCEAGGKLYVFGGSTAPFSGAIRSGWVFDPVSGNWSPLAPMGQERGGATARSIGDLIYVVGGMDMDGDSLSSGEVYDIALDTWSPIASMGTRRDNPVSAVAAGQLYVFGGRTRNSDTTTPSPTLASVESYDPVGNTWTPRAFMPTGRRRAVLGELDGKIQVAGGENTPSGGAFSEHEEYDPATDTWRVLQKMANPRQGAVYGTIDGSVYVAGGGLVAGAGWTTLTERFGF